VAGAILPPGPVLVEPDLMPGALGAVHVDLLPVPRLLISHDKTHETLRVKHAN
jgi:hypothetical protein